MNVNVLVACVLAFALSAAVDAQAKGTVATLTGTAKVKDGDGIVFGDVEVRLQGIAAPEDNNKKSEPGGPEATEHLRILAEGKNVVCELDGSTTRGRPVGVCFIGKTDLGEAQVRAGMARDCPKFSQGRYSEAELSARTNGKNLSAIYPLPPYCKN